MNSKRDIVDCTHRLLELMEKRETLLSDLERNTILSFYFISKLQMSEQELSIMSQAVKIISREGHLRTVFAKEAAAVTGGNSDVKQEVFKKEMKLMSVVEHNKQQCRAAKVVLDAIRKRLKENKTKIESFEERLVELQARRNACHRNIMKQKQKVEFLENALEFWLLMHLISDEPSENLDTAKLIITKAKEKSAPSGRASKILALSLLETMESEMVQAERGYSQVFSFVFHCGS